MVQFPKWQVFAIVGVLVLGLYYALPNVFKEQTVEAFPSWLASDQINLGLDLRGGSYMLLEVDLEAVEKEQMTDLVENIRSILRSASIGYQNLGIQEGGASFTLRDTTDEMVSRVRSMIAQIDGGLLVTSSDGTFSVVYNDQVRQQRRISVVNQSIEVLRRRLDETGTKEISLQRQGENRILIQVPGVTDPEEIKTLIGKTAKLTFHLVDQNADPYSNSAPVGSQIMLSLDEQANGQPRRYVINKRVMVSGENLVDAQATFQDGQPVISFTFDSSGAQRFARVTQDNVNKPFAIVLDGRVISAPVIRSPILTGSGIISGNFTAQSAEELAVLLRAGALPAPLVILEERTIGAGLGEDSINAGKIASVIGMVLVVGFMALAYGFFGLMANVALIANLVLIVAVLSLFQATLTLPGIAGIVLTIGMAVDANVLIFERIREEIRNGRGPVMAVEAGYKRAMSTILDSNITTLIAAVILFQFGSGPIKGFAVTLIIGIITSMFTAIMVTRLLIVTWLRRRRPQTLGI
ncbi:protein translocase subunit SecD [Kiloniella laminariae]|uniref:protein translocase subunit SecD n=1 Tax=Kiloniella laminariae TaxID=454162 RepID=UPI0003775AB6|nr:protein translocase subunit SecD [Kiloniella laminariae]